MNNIKRYSKLIIGFSLAISLILSIGYISNCVGAEQAKVSKSTLASDKKSEKILLEWKGRLEKENKLYNYAVKLFKSPIKSKAVIGKNPDSPHDYYYFIFSNGNEFVVDTLTDIIRFRLKSVKGFSDENEVINVLKQSVRDYQLDLNWQKPKERLEGDEKTIEYEAIADDDNSAAVLVYKKRKLIEVRFHLF